MVLYLSVHVRLRKLWTPIEIHVVQVPLCIRRVSIALLLSHKGSGLSLACPLSSLSEHYFIILFCTPTRRSLRRFHITMSTRHAPQSPSQSGLPSEPAKLHDQSEVHDSCIVGVILSVIVSTYVLSVYRSHGIVLIVFISSMSWSRPIWGTRLLWYLCHLENWLFPLVHNILSEIT